MPRTGFQVYHGLAGMIIVEDENARTVSVSIEASLESGRMTARVKEDVVEGAKVGISGTPGNIIINNKTGDAIPASGALPTDRLQKIVDRLM